MGTHAHAKLVAQTNPNVAQLSKTVTKSANPWTLNVCLVENSVPLPQISDASFQFFGRQFGPLQGMRRQPLRPKVVIRLHY